MDLSEDAMDMLRKRVSTDPTTGSRASATPIDDAPQVAMGASVGATPITPTAESLEMVNTSAPRRRRVRARAPTAGEIDPEEMAKVLAAAREAEEERAFLEEVKEELPVVVEEDSSAKAGLLDSPEQVKPEVIEEPIVKVKTPVAVKTPEVKTPEVKTPEVKTPEVKTPEVKTPEVKTPTPIKASLLGESNTDQAARKELEDVKKELLLKNQELEQYNVISSHVLAEESTEPSAQNLAIFLQTKIDEAEECGRLRGELATTRRELSSAREALAKGTPQVAEMDALNQTIAKLSASLEDLQSQNNLLQSKLTAKEDELALIKSTATGQVLQVADIEELEGRMRESFKQTEAFIEEMEAFTREIEAKLGEANAVQGGAAI